jgi:hypothetical protein
MLGNIDIKGTVKDFLSKITKLKDFADKVKPAMGLLPPSAKPSAFLKTVAAPSSGYLKGAIEEARDGMAEALGALGLGRRRKSRKSRK